jgi:DNA-binding CsgD family transcriptional regulator/tetratricopeptide (TPR) repeat protein
VDERAFVGRREDLAQLRELVAAVAAGAGGVVLVEGEQGIGKSALLRAGLAEAGRSGCRVLWAAADELGRQFPLQLMTDCLGAEGRAAGPAGATVVFAGDPVLAGTERLLAAVDRLCAVSPVLLVAEDLHWADEASVLVWHRLSQAVRQLPLLLAGSWRPGTGREDLARLQRSVLAHGGGLVTLGPLPDAEIGELVTSMVGGRPGRRLSEVLGRAGGNPLYARELTDGLLRDGRVRVTAGVAELTGTPAPVAVPASLAGAVADRLGALAPEVTGVLRWAAVLGPEFSVTDLAVVTGQTAGELMGAVDAAVAAGVVAEAGARLGFRHGLIRQVLYEGMPTALRTALHLQAARALADAGAPPERVAAQLVPAQDAGPGPEGPSEAWVADWLAGAAPALIYRVPQVAAELLRGAVARLASDDPRREALAAGLVTVAFLLARDDEVERTGRELLARSADPDRAAEMAWLVAYTLMRTGRTDEADATARQALDRPGVGAGPAARLRALQAILLAISGQPDQAAEVGQAALADAEQAGSRLSAGYALHALSTVAFILRDSTARLDYADRGLAVLGDDPQATDLRALLLSTRTASLGDLDRQDEAIAAGRQALVLAEQAGLPRQATIRAFLAHRYFELGQWDDALAELESAADLPGPSYLPVMVHGIAALIAGHRDDRATAAEHLAAVRDLAIGGAARPNAHFLLLAQALAAERDEGPAAAAAILAPCLQPDIAANMPSRYLLLPTLIRLALTGADLATVALAATVAADEARHEPLAVKVATAQYCRGLADQDPAPVLAAAAYYERSGRPRERGQALEDAAMLAARRGDRPAARAALTAAADAYGALGARWDVRRAAGRLRSYGVRPGRGSRRGRPASGWAALTPTEDKVARLVAGGRSNPDIAAQLFLSRNTVQTHVSHILAKLGARSRAEIIRAAPEHPAGV